MDNDHIDPEIRENLDALESYLIAYEAILSQGRDDTAQVQYIFRYAHNLKSSLAMIGLLDASSLLHQVESCFDLVRSARRRANENLTRSSLAMIDLLRRNLEDSTAAFPDSTALRAELDHFLEATTNPEDLQVELPFSLNITQADALVKANNSGQQVWLLEKLITSSIPREYFEMLPSFEEAQAAGTILAYHPAWEHLPKNRNECVLQIIFASNLDIAALGSLIHDPIRPLRIPSIDKFFVETEINGTARLILGEHGFKIIPAPPSQGRAICCVGSAPGGFLASQDWQRPGLAVLALGDHAAASPEIWRCLDSGADAFSAGYAEIAAKTAWLEALLFSALSQEAISPEGNHGN